MLSRDLQAFCCHILSFNGEHGWCGIINPSCGYFQRVGKGWEETILVEIGCGGDVAVSGLMRGRFGQDEGWGQSLRRRREGLTCVGGVGCCWG